MKKRTVIWLIAVPAFILLANVGPLHNLLGLLFDLDVGQGTQHYYTTKDLMYQDVGPIRKVRQEPEYKRYCLLYIGRDTTLYRTVLLRPWRFWRWAELISDPSWLQPYLPPPPGLYQAPKREINLNPDYEWDGKTEEWIKKGTTRRPVD